MCGIIGYVGSEQALPILISGLERLEYRGYDSAGIAVVGSGCIAVVKAKGRIENLKKKLVGAGLVPARHGRPQGLPLRGTMGIGHTRWATHGEPSEENAHPHADAKQEFVIVQNGIFENYALLKKQLVAKGYRFSSTTDTEVCAHLLRHLYRDNLPRAFIQTVKALKGYFALVGMTAREPDRLVAYKRSNPLIIGLGENGNFVASDVSAILPYTKKVIYLEDEDLATVTRDRVEILSLKTKKRRTPKPETVVWNLAEAEKSGFPHFMLKEIYEQAEVARRIIEDRLRGKEIYFDTVPDTFFGRWMGKGKKSRRRVVFMSCGTAYHAGLVGRYLLEDEKIAGIPAEVNTSSEFRYYPDPTFGKDDLAIFISQSGETADTLAALKEAKRRKAKTLAIVNVVGSSIAREAEAVIYTHAGPEIGVASTKAYTAQLIILMLLALKLGKLVSKTTPASHAAFLKELKRLPDAIEKVLTLREKVGKAVDQIGSATHFLFLGRGYNFPTALEGALKLKEITYLHAHGYAAGEMKHGPIALVQNDLPVVCLAPASRTREKMLSNIEEIKARGGIIVAVGTEGDRELEDICRGDIHGARGRDESRRADRAVPSEQAADRRLTKRRPYVLSIPAASEPISPILCAVVLQLFAYETARRQGTDVDHPRNLAKSVTVE